MSLKDKYNQMSWILLEYELIYFSKSSIIKRIHPDWLKLRTISDEMYDKKLAVYQSLAEHLGENSNRPVGINLDRPSVKLIIDKFKNAPLSKNAIPLSWPDFATETDFELHFRICQQIFSSRRVKVSSKSKVKKRN